MNFARIFYVGGNQVLLRLEIEPGEDSDRPSIGIAITFIAMGGYFHDVRMSREYHEGNMSVNDAIRDACEIIEAFTQEQIEKDVATMVKNFLAKTDPALLAIMGRTVGGIQ